MSDSVFVPVELAGVLAGCGYWLTTMVMWVLVVISLCCPFWRLLTPMRDSLVVVSKVD